MPSQQFFGSSSNGHKTAAVPSSIKTPPWTSIYRSRNGGARLSLHPSSPRTIFPEFLQETMPYVSARIGSISCSKLGHLTPQGDFKFYENFNVKITWVVPSPPPIFAFTSLQWRHPLSSAPSTLLSHSLPVTPAKQELIQPSGPST